MITGRRDTIAAIATPSGSGGVGIVRLSGPRAIEIAAAALGREQDALVDRRLVAGVARNGDGTRLDEVLAVAMRGPRSYTGEDVAELHGHGGALNMSLLLRSVLDRGARAAEAGEFTRRAFENGRLDLTRAEAVLEVIGASSERAWRNAQAQLGGALGERVRELRANATSLLAAVEACIDFPEEGNDYLREAEAERRSLELCAETERLAGTYVLGRALRDGIDVAIAGPVNSGKSSIFNKLVGLERALVADEPGTTRDFVDAAVVWSGVEVRLIDTAGERSTESSLEQRGIAIGRERAERADFIIATRAVDAAEDSDDRAGANVIQILTKADLMNGELPSEPLATSAITGVGIEQLKAEVVRRATSSATEGSDGDVVTSERQRAVLQRASQAFAAAAEAIRDGRPIEVVAADVREGADRLAETMGEQVGEEVLDELFSQFCIGK
jgi:tRNA modification GTPase